MKSPVSTSFLHYSLICLSGKAEVCSHCNALVTVFVKWILDVATFKSFVFPSTYFFKISKNNLFVLKEYSQGLTLVFKYSNF